MPNYITDVAISELSLVFAEKGGQKFRPVNPEATIIATKAEAISRESLLGEVGAQLRGIVTEKSGSNDADETALKIAYETIVGTLYSALDDLWYISAAPESFTVEARKDAMKMLIDAFVAKISESSALVLKAKVDNRETSVAKEPYQRPPGDHPKLSTPAEPQAAAVEPDPKVEPTTASSEPQPVAEPAAVEKPEPEAEPKGIDEKAQALTELAAMVESLKATIKAQGDELAATRSKLDERDAALEQLIGKAKEPTPNATAPREVQPTLITSASAVPDFKAMSESGNGALAAAIYTQLMAR